MAEKQENLAFSLKPDQVFSLEDHLDSLTLSPESSELYDILTLPLVVESKELMNDQVIVIGTDVKARLKVTVVKIVNPGEFYITMDCLEGEYKELDDAMNEHYTKDALLHPDEPCGHKEFDEPCCAVKIGAQWKRGTIIAADPEVEETQVDGRNVVIIMNKVKLIDENEEVFVPRYTMRHLLPRFNLLYPRVNHCCMSGIQPVPAGSWTEQSIQEFNDLVKRYGADLYLLRTDDDLPYEEGAVWQVEILCPNYDPAETDPWKKISRPELWISLNYKLRNKGFAEADEEFISTEWEGKRNWGGSRREPIRNLMEDENVLVAYVMKQKNIFSTSNEGIDVGLPVAPDVEKMKWFPPEPIDSVFAGKITFVGDSCEVYIQDFVKGSTHTLNIINDEVRRVCEGTEPIECEWEVGDICLAQFHLDSKWYRAEVYDTNTNVHGQHIVRFVDYGNLDFVKSENLRPAVGLTMWPLQAYLCYFDNLSPITEQWEKPALEIIHGLLVDKIGRVEVRELSTGFLGIVSLIFTNNINAVDAIVSRGVGGYLIPPGGEADSYSDVDDDCLPTKRFWWDSYKNQDLCEARMQGTYSLLKIPEDVHSFPAEVTTFLNPDLFMLQVIYSDNHELMVQIECLADIQQTLQNAAQNQQCSFPTQEFEACICKYEEFWYRAVVLAGPTRSNTVAIQYVDYGNSEERAILDTKVMDEEWFSVPAHALPCCIYGYKYSGILTPAEAMQVVGQTFRSEANVIATIKKRGKNRLYVELRNDSGDLVYQDLINSGFYVPC